MSYAAFSDIVKLCPAELFELAQAELGRCGCNGRLAGAVLAVGGLVRHADSVQVQFGESSQGHTSALSRIQQHHLQPGSQQVDQGHRA